MTELKQPTASYMADCLRITTGYAKTLIDDIPAEQFAHQPDSGVNHPAFCIGHLSLYPNKALKLLERDDLVVEKPGYVELFEMSVKCVHQDGRYPEKEEIVDYYHDRHNAAYGALGEVDEEIFSRSHSEQFPTVGAMVNFYLNNHHMLHLGQLSAWRRTMGYPPTF